MRAVTHSHERALERMAVNFAPDLNQTARSEESRRLRPYRVGPATFAALFRNLAVNASFSMILGSRCFSCPGMDFLPRTAGEASVQILRHIWRAGMGRHATTRDSAVSSRRQQSFFKPGAGVVPARASDGLEYIIKSYSLIPVNLPCPVTFLTAGRKRWLDDCC
jgi:hypothetical protein